MTKVLSGRERAEKLGVWLSWLHLGRTEFSRRSGLPMRTIQWLFEKEPDNPKLSTLVGLVEGTGIPLEEWVWRGAAACLAVPEDKDG